NLSRAFEVAPGAVEALRHHAEVDILRAKDVADLPDHLVHAYVGARIACAVVSGKKQLEFFAGNPLFAAAKHPLQARQLDQHADPGNEEKIGHAVAAPVAVVTDAFCDGHGLAG